MGFGRGVVDVAVAGISWAPVDEAVGTAVFPGMVVFLVYVPGLVIELEFDLELELLIGGWG